LKEKKTKPAKGGPKKCGRGVLRSDDGRGKETAERKTLNRLRSREGQNRTGCASKEWNPPGVTCLTPSKGGALFLGAPSSGGGQGRKSKPSCGPGFRKEGKNE